MSPPKYSPLRAGSAIIRMLAILPSMRKKTPIRAISVQVDLDDIDSAPFAFYEALSYTWGTPYLPRVPCKLNGHDHGITENLEAVLKQLRGRTRKRYLWVDTLCINQDDLDERASQVQMMRRIYESAEQVIVWLGPEANDSSGAIKTLDHFTDLDCDEDLGKSMLDNVQLGRWTAVAKLFDREWFRRVWIRQEVAVAREIMVMCGRECIPWPTLCLACDLLTSPDISTDFENVVLTVSNRGSGAHWVRTIEMFRETYAEEGGCDLEILLLHARGADVTDPRDRVYGLLGLAHKDASPKVDYSLTAPEVFVNAMVVLLQSARSLDCLSGCQLSARVTASLPSWVIDLNADFEAMVLRPREGGQNLYHAAADEPASFSIHESDRTLRAQGYMLDTVRFVRKTLPGSEERAEWFTSCLQLTRECVRQRRPEASEIEIMHDFCRLLVADTNDVGDRANIELWDPYLQGQTLDSLPARLAEMYDNDGAGFTSRMSEVCAGRTVFATFHGYFGLSDKACEEGDLVCILLGAGVPFVLRRQTNHYGLVSEAYVQGVMDGEAIQSKRAEGLPPIEFWIR